MPQIEVIGTGYLDLLARQRAASSHGRSRPDPEAVLGKWVVFKGSLDLGDRNDYLNVEVETASYYNIPPPDFWAMTSPLIWGQFLIIQTEFWLEAVNPDQQGIRIVVLHMSEHSRRIHNNRIAVDVMVWISGTIEAVDGSIIHLKCNHIIPGV
ncbi:hypothetical protein PCANC_20140 [Puccinia coronata f. sp. avenae]|uniref:Uncharacterized protein n=1 Tax=Puccinia coronata f. sp. avenae TaxID=200324 RepID=A0A2N5TWE0_9BASI|nr:hypothetical protein PCANC_20140 [Puccinia coronata f. sp. avenae]